MLKIKFSHPYSKLIGEPSQIIKTAKLLAVIPTRIEFLQNEFLSYDTDNGKFRLPEKGLFIILLFEKPCKGELAGRNLFTTLRPGWPTHKVNYYKRKIGMDFKIVLP